MKRDDLVLVWVVVPILVLAAVIYITVRYW
jgi:hypothetical protein